MKINIDIQKDLRKLQKQLGDIKSKQIPYAITKTLNELATEARPLIQEEFNRELKIRSKGLLRAAIQINWAKKSDWPFIQSEVGVLDGFDFLSDHANGEVRRARSSKGKAIPVEAKRLSSGKMPERMKPSTLLKRKGIFMITTKRGQQVLVKRTTKERYPIKVMYGFSKEVKIVKNVFFEASAAAMFNSRFDLILGKNLAKAIANAK